MRTIGRFSVYSSHRVPRLSRYARLPCPNCTASQDAGVAAPSSSASGGPGDDPPRERWNWLDSPDAQRSHAILAAVLGVGTLPWVQEVPNAPLMYFVALAVTTIYIGSHKALTTELRQQISFKEGFLAPVAASVSLFGLYLLIKYFPDLSLQTFIDGYFFLLGSFALSSGATCLLQAVPGFAKQSIKVDLPDWMFTDENGQPAGRSSLSPAQVAGLAAPTRLLFPRFSAAGDIGAFPFSLLGLGDVVVPGLLAGLALRYDASRAVDLRPRADAAIGAIDDAIASLPPGADQMAAGDAAADAADAAYDAVADADDARQDAARSGDAAEERVAATEAVMEQRRYFSAVMVAYGGGLVVAFAANAVTGMGQPALLYLCPMTLAATAALAASRRELGRVWSFVDQPSVTPFQKQESK